MKTRKSKPVKSSPNITHAILLGQTASQIEESLRRNGFFAYTNAYSLEDAVLKAGTQAVPGGNVLFSPACASFDMFRDYEQRGAIFKEIVQTDSVKWFGFIEMIVFIAILVVGYAYAWAKGALDWE